MDISLGQFDLYLMNLIVFIVYFVLITKFRNKLNIEWHLSLMLIHIAQLMFYYSYGFNPDWKVPGGNEIRVLFLFSTELFLVLSVMKIDKLKYKRLDWFLIVIFFILTDAQIFLE